MKLRYIGCNDLECFVLRSKALTYSLGDLKAEKAKLLIQIDGHKRLQADSEIHVALLNDEIRQLQSELCRVSQDRGPTKRFY